VLMLMVEFKDNLDTDEIMSAIENVRSNIKSKYPLVKHVLVQPSE
jgi:hypothetical protein